MTHPIEDTYRAGMCACANGEARTAPTSIREGSWLWAAWLDGWDHGILAVDHAAAAVNTSKKAT